MNTAAALFDKKFDSITNVIEFNNEWNNGIGYFDAAVNLMEDGEPNIVVTLKPGEMAKCVSQDGQKMIFIGTDLGTCVVFQCYKDSSDTLVANQARLLAKSSFIKKRILHHYADLARIIGSVEYDEVDNVGVTMANIKKCLADLAVSKQ